MWKIQPLSRNPLILNQPVDPLALRESTVLPNREKWKQHDIFSCGDLWPARAMWRGAPSPRHWNQMGVKRNGLGLWLRQRVTAGGGRGQTTSLTRRWAIWWGPLLWFLKENRDLHMGMKDQTSCYSDPPPSVSSHYKGPEVTSYGLFSYGWENIYQYHSPYHFILDPIIRLVLFSTSY